jgi:uncharacterized protein (TIGR02265 family)
MKIKGLVLQSRKDFVIEHFGEEGWGRVVGSMSQADQDVLGGVIFAAKWYPFDAGERLDRAIVRVLGGGDTKVFEEMGAKSARRSLAKEHKSFLSPGDPQALMAKTSLIYRFYYDTGYREYEPTGPNSGVMTTYEAEAFSTPDCLTVIGWYKEALKMCGAKKVTVYETDCRARGGRFCRYRLQWEM